MGSESDSVSEQFVPRERYKTQQRAVAETLLAAGFTPEQISAVLPFPVEPSTGKSKDR
jgi:hypothetical protein